MSEYFLKPDVHSSKSIKNIEVELDLSNYVTKADLKKQQVLVHLILQQNEI